MRAEAIALILLSACGAESTRQPPQEPSRLVDASTPAPGAPDAGSPADGAPAQPDAAPQADAGPDAWVGACEATPLTCLPCDPTPGAAWSSCTGSGGGRQTQCGVCVLGGDGIASCAPAGSRSTAARVGDRCAADAECPVGAACFIQNPALGTGVCAQVCGGPEPCPTGTTCRPLGACGQVCL